MSYYLYYFVGEKIEPFDNILLTFYITSARLEQINLAK